VTFATDLALTIQGLIFGLLLFWYWYATKEKRTKPTLMWVGGFISVALFALFGALSHGTNLVALGDAFWPPTMIFGGIAFIFFVAGIIIYQKETNYGKLILIPVALVIIYLIIGFLINWPFLLWVFLLIFCSIIIYIFTFRAKKDEKFAAKYIIWGLTIIIIAGVIQAVGGFIGYQTYFGPSNEFLFQPHNDIFHIVAMVGLCFFFIGFRKDMM
jgi:hypothetical protein